MHASQTEAPAGQVILDAGGWISGPALKVQPRRLARDIRDDRVGEIMDQRQTSQGSIYDLRPVGGGREWEVPREFVQLLDKERQQ